MKLKNLNMNIAKLVARAALGLMALYLTAAAAQPESKPVHVNIFETCLSGLVIWEPVPHSNKKCGQLPTPQVKIFDGVGRLRFIGSALDAIQWNKSGQPSTPIPSFVVVRDAASEARFTHVAAPQPGNGWVTYYSGDPCPPCQTQLVTFRSEVMPKLGANTKLSLLEIGE